MTPQEAAVSVRDLRVVLAGTEVEVISGVSFAVPRGSVLGLVGESGSGKSTVARALLGYSRPGLHLAGGEVLVEGVDLLQQSPARLRGFRGRKIAYVPQNPGSALNPGLRIGTQLRETLDAHTESAHGQGTSDRIAEVLRDVQLDPEALRAYPHQLSGGQQQRVTLAMAFACRPAVIVLDEPTTGLDVTTQRHVLETVQSLCRAYGVGAVYVTHDLAVVSELADRVVVMYAGKVVESGPTDRLFTAPLHPYTQGLIMAAPSHWRSLALVGIPGSVPAPGRHPAGCSFSPRCHLAIAACTEDVPPLESVGDSDHLVRCIRASEWASAGPRAPERRLRDEPVDASADLVLAVSRLDGFHGPKQVLRAVSFSVPRNECVAIVGESGSGKSTLAHCIVGLHSSYTGTVAFEGQHLAPRVRDRTHEQAQAIQYVFQNPHSSLNPRKNVGQILGQPLAQFFRPSRAEEIRRVGASLEEVALDPSAYLRKYPGELSGGEAQRVAIARALIVEPRLLICDEVTSSLDASVQAVIIELLHQLQRTRGLAMVFITHNLPLVRSVAHTVIVLHDGEIVERGPVVEVVERPSAPYTMQLFEDAPRLAVVDG
jgi:peptide/nickel transport system ATP-binding protein